MPRDHLFPEKCPNCPGWIYSDNENEDHYDDFDEYGQCNYRKLQQGKQNLKTKLKQQNKI